MKYDDLIKQFMPIVESKVKIAYYKGKYWYVNPNSPNDLVSMKDTSLGIDSKGKHRILSGDEEKKQLNAIKDAIKDGTLQNYKGIVKISDTNLKENQSAAVEKLSDTFGISKDSITNAETTGFDNYSISIGEFKDNWYACEDDRTNPQIWKFKTKKELATAIKSDTGLEI